MERAVVTIYNGTLRNLYFLYQKLVSFAAAAISKKYINPEIMLVSTLLGSLSSNIYQTIGIYSKIALVRYVEGPTSARFVLFDAASISNIEINPHGMVVR